MGNRFSTFGNIHSWLRYGCFIFIAFSGLGQQQTTAMVAARQPRQKRMGAIHNIKKFEEGGNKHIGVDSEGRMGGGERILLDTLA